MEVTCKDTLNPDRSRKLLRRVSATSSSSGLVWSGPVRSGPVPGSCSMDSHIKTGKVYLKPHKPHKKWKPVMLSLFAPSSSSVGRLEIGDGAGGADLRRPHQLHGEKKVKVVRLSELISVLRLPPNAEACHLDNMSMFCVETEDRTLVFAAPKDDCL